MPQGYDVRPEQALLFTITAWDMNCSQHIPRKVNFADAAAMLASRDARIEALEAELLMLRGQPLKLAPSMPGDPG